MGELGLHHLGDAVLVFELVSLVLQCEGSSLPAVQQQCTEVYIVHWENVEPAIHTSYVGSKTRRKNRKGFLH